MSRIRSIVMAGALAFATALPVAGTAEAGPMGPVPLKVDRNSDVTNVAACGRWGCRGGYYRGGYRGRYAGPRYRYGNRYGYRYRYGGPRYGYYRGPRYRYWGGGYWPGYWAAPVVVAPTVVYRNGGGWNAHVRWCLNRYVSYNPRTNTFLSYDGYYKRCRSPYR